MGAEMANMNLLLAFIFILVYGFMFLLAIGMYVLEGLGFYWLAKSVNHKTPYFSWIPVCSTLLLGDLAQEIKIGKKIISGRKAAITSLIINLTAAFVYIIATVIFTVIMATKTLTYTEVAPVIPILLFICGFFIYFVALIVAVIIQYSLLYNIYKRFAPNNAMLYLLLSIFISAMPIIVFILGRRAMKERNNTQNNIQIVDNQ